ncbi:hypothetical protein TNIN_395251 [Trichonephila inaurata madagascariensis]|uniref:Uncharacterized protein n=1 Tax=Trichonephila inaurata madagascariensis TaxID=2747483 RepID=A0A8X7CQS0_9ARAC|nr:hypothetical protein TNIN_395251 [Trichonephila inaurata madagascariensis]
MVYTVHEKVDLMGFGNASQSDACTRWTYWANFDLETVPMDGADHCPHRIGSETDEIVMILWFCTKWNRRQEAIVALVSIALLMLIRWTWLGSCIYV